MGIENYLDVCYHLPRRYDSFLLTPRDRLLHIKDKERVVIHGRIVGRPSTLRFRNMSNTSFYLETDTGIEFKVLAWNRSYLASFLDASSDFTVSGSFDAKRHQLNLLAIKKGVIAPSNALVPVYQLPEGYLPANFRKLVEKSLKECQGAIPNVIPLDLREKYKLIDKEIALNECHFPKSIEDIHDGLRVLKYEESLLFSLKNQIIRNENKALSKAVRRDIDIPRLKEFIYSLPYKLTKSQGIALKEILDDMNDPSLMYRLLQGDVGMGKTLVAALAMYANYTRGEQSALMAPTDTLARQHYENLTKMFASTKVNVVLLVGAMGSAERKEALSSIEFGDADIVVGTHALFGKAVNYANLGLAIIDEQHKFGVNQRTLLAAKGDNADLLLMSATPIPRTLSLSLYGDLDISTLTDFPSGKRDVDTTIVDSSSPSILASVKKAIKENRRVYVVAPQIEEGEEEFSSAKAMYQRFLTAFPGLVTLVHGKMSNEEKEAAMLAFKVGMKPILVATSVIEVGIDVKEANLMIVYDASHFALSSLHQLRGRIGRDGSPSKMLLVYDGDDEDELDKLKVMTDFDDGFRIAEEDLRRRGPGTLAGVRQSGLPDFRFANLVDDFRMFECARNDAAMILADKDNPKYKKLLQEARNGLEGISLA